MKASTIVIGAGASGLVAAGFLARGGVPVLVLEKNKQAVNKVRITGKGRCNITNAMPIEEFFSHYPGNGRFLYGALYRFTNEDCLDFFTSLGVQLKVERGKRVFPASDDANEVADALERFAKEGGARICYGHKVMGIEKDKDGAVKGVRCLLNGGEIFIPAQAVVVATGGRSYPGTGSSGDGYLWAQELGHTIVQPRPALVPVKVKEEWVKELSGLSLKNVELTIINQKAGQDTFFGEMMFTHFGLSGPIILTASEVIGRWLEETGKPVVASLNLKPALSKAQLDQRLIRDFEKFSRKQFSNSLNELLPKSLIPIIVRLSKIPPEKPCHQITREEREALGNLLQNLSLTITATLPLAAAIVTAGGVDVKEINPKTMESKIVKGLYFVGEVLDVHGVTGGFNLQAAFSTGYSAATAVVLD